jgi:hypothetical protein
LTIGTNLEWRSIVSLEMIIHYLCEDVEFGGGNAHPLCEGCVFLPTDGATGIHVQMEYSMVKFNVKVLKIYLSKDTS